MEEIYFFDRYQQAITKEYIYKEQFLRFIYGNPVGKAALHTLVKRHFFSWFYGKKMSQQSSQKLIQPFIKKYGINCDEHADDIAEYQHFNDFFYRKLKPQARPITTQQFALPADGRHLAIPNIKESSGFFVKGQQFCLASLLQNQQLAQRYQHGSMLISRLCPVDYHRFHFPITGKVKNTNHINGHLYSVSPYALRQKLHYLWHNKRTLTTIYNDQLGDVLMLEIGATCVGGIHQTYPTNSTINKGDEKGFFSFGGSMTILIFLPEAVRFSDDLIENSSQYRETYAHVGDYFTQ